MGAAFLSYIEDTISEAILIIQLKVFLAPPPLCSLSLRLQCKYIRFGVVCPKGS